jgi:membrane protein DedA with SNARE-associated domain
VHHHLSLAVHLIRWLTHLRPDVDYGVVFLVTLVEGTGMPGVPFEPIFLGTGYLIAAGHLGYVPAVLAGAGGNLAGNLIGYLVGALAGRYLKGERAARLGLTPERLGRVQRWFRLYGGRTVFIGRWFGPIRTPAILAAGFTHMDPAVYGAWSALGAVSWVGVWLFVTWKFGAAAVRAWHRYGWQSALGLAAAALVVYLAWRWFAAGRRGEEGGRGEGGARGEEGGRGEGGAREEEGGASS